MANDERQSEQFIREVDEELRRAQLKALWDRFAPLIIGVCILIVVVTAGYRGWMWWQERQASQAGDRFMAALSEIESGDRAKGEAELAAMAAESGAGYAALARLRLAGAKAAAGDKPAAISAYDAVANDAGLPQPLRDIGRMRAALLALDTGDLTGAKQRADPLHVAGNPWRHAAREVIGLAAYQSGDLQAARDAFTEIQQDAESPQDLWLRSGLMVSLIDGQLAAPGSEASGGGTMGSEANQAAPASAPSPAAGSAPAAAPAPAPAPSPAQPAPAPSPSP